MRAVRYHGPRDLRLEDVPDRDPASGEVKLRVAACGICGSDVHEYVSGPNVIPAPGRPHPLTGTTLPVTLGHEYAGHVVDVGDDVPAAISRGQLVAIEPLLRCGACVPCRQGAYNLCRRQAVLGLSAGGGGLAEFALVPHELVHPVPAGIDAVTAALIEPISVGWHGVARSGMRLGATALVIGAGPVGLGVLLSLRAAGAGLVVVSPRREGARARVARELGAHAVVIPEEGRRPLVAAVELAGGDGFDVVFETAGQPAALAAAMQAVRPGGTIVQLALWQTRPQVDLNRVLAREVSIVGSMGYAREYPAVMACLADGRMADATLMVTSRVGIADAVDAFDALAAGDREQVKVIVTPAT